LCLSLSGWRTAVLCLVVPGPQALVACRGFFAGPDQPAHRRCLGLAFTGSIHEQPFDGGIGCGTGQRIYRAMGLRTQARASHPNSTFLNSGVLIMESTIRTLIESRVSLNYYDPDRPVSEAQIKELVRLATLAPSAYNLQNWKFIVVQSSEAKQRLKTVAYGQQKIEAAPVTFIVCGLLEAHRQLPLALRPAVDAGIIAPSVSDAWVAAAARSDDGNAVPQMDEASRSASLAAITLMLAAEGMRLGSATMGGCDRVALSRASPPSHAEVPVMLTTIGSPA